MIDVGCGSGTKLEILHRQLPDVRFVGIDRPGAIEICRNKYNFGEWYVDDVENPDPALSNIKGELVICADVIEHIIDPDKLLHYLKHMVTLGGYIIQSTPERDLVRGQDATSPGNKYHVREWNYHELESYLENRGFVILSHFLQYPIRFTFNGLFYREIVRRVLQRKALKYDQCRLLTVEY